MGCIALVRCVLVLRCDLAVVDTTPPKPNHNKTTTQNKPNQNNQGNNKKNKSQAPEDGCINIRNILSIK